MSDKLSRLPIWYILAPLATIILILPPILDLPPLRHSDNLNVVQIIIVIPFYLGLLAAPGYLYAWSGHHDRKRLNGAIRFWIDISLGGAVLAAFGGLISVFTVIVFPFDIASLAAAVFLICRYWGVKDEFLTGNYSENAS